MLKYLCVLEHIYWCICFCVFFVILYLWLWNLCCGLIGVEVDDQISTASRSSLMITNDSAVQSHHAIDITSLMVSWRNPKYQDGTFISFRTTISAGWVKKGTSFAIFSASNKSNANTNWNTNTKYTGAQIRSVGLSLERFGDFLVNLEMARRGYTSNNLQLLHDDSGDVDCWWTWPFNMVLFLITSNNLSQFYIW